MNTAQSPSSAATLPANSTSPEPLPCPRCNSHDTKFCYYNNYNLTQPRHYCRTCRRYWTQGGTLRNVPVGGGCRKNKQVVPTEFTKSRPTTPLPNFTIWKPNANPNPSYPVPDAHNGFQLIQSEVVPDHPFQVDAPGFGTEEMNQYLGGYNGNVDEYDSNVEFGSVSGIMSVSGSEFGYWNPELAWPDYPATNGALR